MKRRSQIASAVLAMAAHPAFAHPGHHMPGESHWHAADVAVVVAIAVGAVIAVWVARRGR